MSKQKKVKPKEGMLVQITLAQGFYGLGIIAKCQARTGGVFDTIWGLYDIKTQSIDELKAACNQMEYLQKPVMVLGMDYEELEKGKWPVLGIADIKFKNIDFENSAITKKLFKETIPGAMLLEMYLGLQPWNLFKDAEAVDKRLLPGFSRPKNVWLKE